MLPRSPGLYLPIQNLSFISYAFIYFHAKGRFQNDVNARPNVIFSCHFHETQTAENCAFFYVIARLVVDPEDGTDRVPRKVGKKLSLLAA